MAESRAIAVLATGALPSAAEAWARGIARRDQLEQTMTDALDGAITAACARSAGQP